MISESEVVLENIAATTVATSAMERGSATSSDNFEGLVHYEGFLVRCCEFKFMSEH